MKKIVILGHTGFVGSNLRPHLERAHPDHAIIGLSSREVDLADGKKSLKLRRYFDLETTVIVCSGVKSNYGNDLDIYRKNVAMAENICRVLQTHPVRRLLFFSSISIYGVDVSNARITESTPVDPDTYYGLAKLDSERLLTFAFAKMPESSLVILRPSIIYGPGETILAATPSGFLIKYLEGGEVTLWGDGGELREFLLVGDLVQAVDRLAFSAFKGVVNIGGDTPRSYKESLEIIERLLDRKLVVHSKPRSKPQVDKAYAPATFSEWFPDFKFTPLEEGLKIILASRTGRDHYQRTSCRLCNSDKFTLVAPIGKSAVGGAFVPKSRLKTKQAVYPLDLYQCQSCGHVQLRDVVDPGILFSDYTYFSGKTGLIKHFDEYARNVMADNQLQPGAFVVDIGSNDGAFLGCFKEKGMKVLGIDPATNVADYANARGIETLPLMFDAAAAAEIRRRYGPADVITANNVFAHADNLRAMATGIRDLLKDDGVFYFEASYLLDVVDKMLLGAIFHEHLSYHTVKSMAAFLAGTGLELIDVRRVGIQGGSIIGKVQRQGGGRAVAPSVAELIALEEARGVYDVGFFDGFNRQLADLKARLGTVLKDMKRQGLKIAGFGAARGGTLITYLFGLGKYLEYIVDDDPDKHGLYSPGLHIPVLPTSALYAKKPDCVIILAWVHSKSIIEKNRQFLENGGKFITFFPTVEII